MRSASALDLAAEDEGDDAPAHVLVYAGEREWPDVESGLLEDFADEPVGDGFVELEDAAGWLPVAVVRAAYDEKAAGVVDDRGGDAYGVLRRFAGI
jgi:hypothetical protein